MPALLAGFAILVALPAVPSDLLGLGALLLMAGTLITIVLPGKSATQVGSAAAPGGDLA